MSNTIGEAYLQIRPSMEGVSKDIEKALGDVGGSAGKSFASALGSASKVALEALGAASSAMVGMGLASVKVGAEFDASMSQVAATMGTTVDQIGELRDFAQQMGSTTAFSATEAADALNYMALAGYDADKSMEMLPNVLNLAAAGGIDLAYASDMVTDAASALGLSTQETAIMIDQMAAASSKSNTSVEQLGEAILTIGATAANVQGGTQELSTVLGALADNGIKGAEGGTHLRNMLLSLQDAAVDGAVDFGEFSVEVYDAEGNMRSMIDIIGDMQTGMDGMSQAAKDATISGVFNKTDLASVNALLNTSQERFTELGSAIEGSATISNILGDSLEGMVADMQYSYEQLGGDAEAFASEMKDYLTFEYDLDDTKAQAAIDTFLTSVSEGVTETDALTQAIGSAGGAASAMAETQLDNLAGDITLFKSALEGAQIAISDSLSPTLREFVQFGSDGLSKITLAFQEGGLDGAMTAFGEVLSQGLAMLIEMLPEVIDAGMQLLGALGQGILDNLPTLLDAAIQIVLQIADGIIEALPTLIPAIVDIVLTIVDKLTDPDTIVQLVEAALQLIIALAEGLITALPKLIEKAPEIIKNLLVALIKAAPMILEAGMELIFKLVEGILMVIGKLVEMGANLVQSVKDGFWEKVEAAKDWGKDLIDNFIGGIKDKIQAVKDTVGAVAQTVKDILGFSEPEEGPLSNFHTFAPDMMQLFSQGIKDNLGLVTEAMNDVTGTIASDFTNAEVAPARYAPVADPNERIYGLMNTTLAAEGGNITIPVYIGQEKIDTIVINAQQRHALVSGGR